MMQSLYRQLCALLADAGYTAYVADAVPPDAAFPFVTVDARPSPSVLGTGRLTLTGWLRSDCRHADRLAMADALLRLVPPGGRKLLSEGGLAVLFRGDRLNVEWPEAPGALGVCVKHELRMMGGGSDA